MEFGALLAVHLIGAGMTALAAAYACVVMVKSEHASYRRAAITLGALAAFEVVTGTSLAILSPSLTVLSVCGNIALYLAAVGFFQTLLYMRIKQATLRFPIAQTFSPVGASIALVLAALALGL